jgi:hypothetical protein
MQRVDMPRNLTEDELQQFFEEIWQLAERVAASDDSCLAARLFELADEVAEWRNELQARPASSTN